jgi:hypothetical protein
MSFLLRCFLLLLQLGSTLPLEDIPCMKDDISCFAVDGVRFFETEKMYPELMNLRAADILAELTPQGRKDWVTPPDQLASRGSWSILPLFGFGHWSQQSQQFPRLVEALKGLNGLRLAIFSQMVPGTELKPHFGAASLANEALRNQLTLEVPLNSFLYVTGKKHRYRKGWITYDDSKEHWVTIANETDTEHLMLIVDLVRPPHVPKGNSTEPDSDELLQFVNAHKAEL